MASLRTPRSDAILDFASQIKSAVIAAVIFLHSGFVLQRHSGQQGLVGTEGFAALRRRGTIDVAVPGAASEPSPEPLRLRALGVWECPGTQRGLLPQTHNGFLTSKIKAQGMN